MYTVACITLKAMYYNLYAKFVSNEDTKRLQDLRRSVLRLFHSIFNFVVDVFMVRLSVFLSPQLHSIKIQNYAAQICNGYIFMNHLITITIKEQMVPDVVPVEELLDVGITNENDIQEQPHNIELPNREMLHIHRIRSKHRNNIEHPNIIEECRELPNCEMLHNHRIRSKHRNKGCDTSPPSSQAMSCISKKSDDEDECYGDWIRCQRQYKDSHKKVFVL